MRNRKHPRGTARQRYTGATIGGVVLAVVCWLVRLLWRRRPAPPRKAPQKKTAPKKTPKKAATRKAAARKAARPTRTTHPL